MPLLTKTKLQRMYKDKTEFEIFYISYDEKSFFSINFHKQNRKYMVSES